MRANELKNTEITAAGYQTPDVIFKQSDVLSVIDGRTDGRPIVGEVMVSYKTKAVTEKTFQPRGVSQPVSKKSESFSGSLKEIHCFDSVSGQSTGKYIYISITS